MKSAGEVRLDDDKIGRMGYRAPPTEKYRAIRKAEAENLSIDGAMWVTSPWKPSRSGYIGLTDVRWIADFILLKTNRETEILTSIFVGGELE